jgi:hypothetical protein
MDSLIQIYPRNSMDLIFVGKNIDTKKHCGDLRFNGPIPSNPMLVCPSLY